MKLRPHTIALHCCLHKAGTLCGMFARQLLCRIIALSPLAAVYLLHWPLAAAIPLCIGLYLLLVFPMRFQLAFQMTCMTRQAGHHGLHISPFFTVFKAGCFRLFSGALWGAPLAFFLYRTYQYIFVFEGTRFGRDFIFIGNLLSPAAVDAHKMFLGSAVFFGALILSFFLLLYGWWRGVPLDFQTVGDIRLKTMLHNARRARRRCKGALWKNVCLHFLLCLPALIFPLLLPYLKLRPMLVGRAMEDLQLIYVFLSAGMVSDGTLAASLILFLALYLPFLPYRKLHNAAVVVNCYADKR